MERIRIHGELNRFLRMPFWLLLILVATNAGVYAVHRRAGLLMMVGLVIYVIVQLVIYYRRSDAILREMITFAAQYGQIQKQLMRDFPVPYAVVDESGTLLWTNRAFQELTGRDYRSYQKPVKGLFPVLTSDRFPDAGQETVLETEYDGKDLRIEISSLVMDSMIEGSEILEKMDDDHVFIYSLLIHDETELRSYIRRYEEETMVCGLVYLDNYDEALESVEDVRRSLLTALIDRKISQYFQELDAVVRKFEKDKYIVVMRTRSLQELKDKRFSILEDVKNVNIGNDMAVTISIGIGANTGSYTRNAESARIAIDLALGRGGDQVVLRDGESITYFGGRSQAVEKNTRVKARVKAHALKEFIDSKEKVVVMGHQLIDIDSFGAAVGMYRAVETLEKRAHIVVDSPTTSTQPFISGFRNDPEYPSDMLISVQEAKEMVDSDTLLIVVDTNRPDYTECEELLSRTRTVVVLDHHRQSNNDIKDAVLSYIEPYASSACEMVTEILQYFPEEVRLRNIEADALYAGIIVDTDNFMQKAGVRTFEAAAFLRRRGADSTRVRKMFRESTEESRVKGEIVRQMELYRGHFAISVCPSAGLESPTIVASQAANQLLDIRDVKASFVLTDLNDTIYISARAIDEINVQIIMERLGGGGHMNIAGAQLPDTTIEEAQTRLKQVLDDMLDGGEIG